MMESKGTTGMNAKVIHVDLKPSFSDHVREDMVHKGLECRRCIAKPKEHYCGFIKTKGSDEGCFLLIRFLDPNIVISPLNVKLSEINRVFHIINEFRDKGQRIGISDDVGV